LNNIGFLTPFGAFVALVVVLPLLGFAAFERRADRVRQILHLREASSRARWIELVSLTLVAAALGIAAAQPVLTHNASRASRTDAEAYVAIDMSKSMEARTGGGASRFDRAKGIAVRLRAALPDVPFGVASFASTTLPHLFPSSDLGVFAATVRDAVRIGSPPASSVYYQRRRTTDLMALAVLPQGYFDQSAKHRLVIVFTDGETITFSPEELAFALRPSRIKMMFVRVWGPNERIFLSRGRIDPVYRPDPSGGQELERLATTIGGAAFSEHDVGRIIAQARTDLGAGPNHRLASLPRRTPLAPWALAIAFLPLGVILRRRNL
jgi:hypothetical protein